MKPHHHQLSAVLSNGKPVLLRTVLAEDKSRFQEGFSLLSPESRYLRFFSYLKELSEAQLNYLSQVDQLNHVAWGALDESCHPTLGVGVGRFIRVESCPNCAEIAITVLDEFQGKGLGTLLFAVMYLLAQAHDVETFIGSVLAANQGVVRRLREINATLTGEEGQFSFEIPIYQNFADLPTTTTGQRLRTWLEKIASQLFLPE